MRWSIARRLIIAGGSAYARHWDFAKFREIADEIEAVFFVDMAHFAGLVAGGAHPSPFPHAHVVTTTTHKTLRGPRGGMILTNDEAIAKKINSAIFPGLQGGPLMHVIAAKAVSFHEALTPEFKAYAHAVVANAKALAAPIVAGGYALVTDGTDNHLMLVDLRPKGLTGKAAEIALGRAHITIQQERRAVRSGAADDDLGHSPRLARGDIARLWRRGVQPRRRTDRRDARWAGGAWRRGQCGRRGQGARRCGGADAALPDLLEAALSPHGGAREKAKESEPMRCPYCGGLETQVKDSRPTEDASSIRRRRICPDCGGRFTTFERVQLREMMVLKKSGRRVPFDRDKLQRSVDVALRKRSATPERIERLMNGIVRQLESLGDGDITTEKIGELVMEGLKALDDVAYVRFASVYRNFREARDFSNLVGQLESDPEPEPTPEGGARAPRPR